MLRSWLHWRALIAVGAITTCSILATVACDDSNERATFDGDAGTDSGPSPNLPPTPSSPAADGGAGSSFDAASEPVSCEVSPCVVELAAGANHVCARLSTGEVSCWGENSFGAVGDGTPEADPGTDDGGGKGGGKGDPGPVERVLEDVTRPTPVTDVSNITQISAAYRTTCARRVDGAVLCWGGNEWGQLGLAGSPAISDWGAHPYRNQVELGGGASRVDVGQRTACALLASGELSCWGMNDAKQLARAEEDVVLGPGTSDRAGFVVTRTAGSDTSSYAVTDDGGLLTWGELAAREGSLNPDPVPARIPSLSEVHDVAAAPTHACAIAGGRVYCWGSSQAYALCTGLPSSERLPAHAILQTSAFPQQLSVSINNTCVRLTDGTIQCCGAGILGQLAVTPPDGEWSAMSFTRAANFDGHAVQVVTTDIATCALLRTGAVECWGGNKHGELGQGTSDKDAHPVPAVVSFQ